MPEEAPKVLKQESRRKEAVLLPPSDIRAVAPLLIVGSLALCVAGWVDAGLFWIPLHFGNTDWEIGTIGQTVDALPLGTIALLLLATGVRAAGGRRIWPRMLSVLFVVISLFLVGCLAIFLLDLPQILTAANSPGGRGIKRGAAKVILFGVTYVIMYAAAGILNWRATSRRESGSAPSKPAAQEARQG